ncbi:MAG: hypothetical protein WCD37_02075 [Chloroflexia bacterium]
MNLNILEKVAREVKKSNQVVKPVEHKDITSLSTQIAANLRANGLAGSAALPTQVYSTDGLRWF